VSTDLLGAAALAGFFAASDAGGQLLACRAIWPVLPRHRAMSRKVTLLGATGPSARAPSM
jgi:hypothetical protein